MIGHSAWQRMKSGVWVGLILFLAGGIGVQAAPVVSSFKINNGAVSTMNPAVTLPNVCEGAASATHSYMASESPDFTGAAWKPYASVPLFILSNTTSGTKTVYFKVKDSTNAESDVTSDTITLGGEGYSFVPWDTNGYVPSPNQGIVETSTGAGYGLGLKSDGSIVAWGWTGNGISDVPSPNSGFVAVSAGTYHSLGLKADGSIVGWGADEYGQCTVPSPNSGFVAIAAGGYHSLGLKSDGSIVAWGWNNFGQCVVPSANSGFSAISAGNSHNLGLKSDGSIVAWGWNEVGQCTVPAPNSGFVSCAAGSMQSFALRSNGSIVSWGENSIGQSNIPLPNSGFTAVVEGNGYGLGLKSDGSVQRWGFLVPDPLPAPASPNNGFVALATGGGLAPGEMGELLVALNPPEAVAAGAKWLLSNEAEVVWHNSGDTVKTRGTQTRTLTFKNVYGWNKPQDQVVTIEAGHIVSRVEDYSRVLWTLSTECQNGTVNAFPSGTSFPHETTVTLAAQPNAGYWFDHWMGDVPAGQERLNPLVITMDAHKTIRADFEPNPAPSAPVVSTLTINNGLATTVNPTVILRSICTGTTSASATLYMASESPDFSGAAWRPYAPLLLFRLSEGAGDKTVYFKVKNSAGKESFVTSEPITRVGNGFSILTTSYNVPVPNHDFVAIAAGENQSLGLKSDGSVTVWGGNDFGQCQPPSPNKDFVAIAGGGMHNIGLKSDGSVFVWGAGQYDLPESNRDFVAVAAGEYHNLGLKSDGSVVAWGDNNIGQNDVPAPNRDFVAVSAGYFHSLGLKADGSIVAWGNNDKGQCSVPSPNCDFVAIAAGYYHSLGLKSDGSIVAWGLNVDNYQQPTGQCDVPAPNSDFVAIAAGEEHSLGLKSDGSVVAFGRNVDYLLDFFKPNTGYVGVTSGGYQSLVLSPEGMGDLIVKLSPSEGVAAGAKWRLESETTQTWHNSGNGVRTRGEQTLTFKEVYGWIKPADQAVTITTDDWVEKAGEYRRTSWTLTTSCEHGTVTLSPVGPHFLHETTVTVTVQPDPGYWFDRWTGDVPVGREQALSFVVTMDADKTLEAHLGTGALPPPPVVSTFKINSGAALTANPAVTLANTCEATSSAVVQYQASESPDFTGAEWKPYASVPLFTLSSATSGTKTVYFKVKNTAGVESAVTSDTISLRGYGCTVVSWGQPFSMKGLNSDFVALSIKGEHCLGLKTNGAVVMWGMYGGGAYIFPSPNRDFVAISAGISYGLGLKSDGSIVAWGDNSYGQCDVPGPNRDFVAIAAGENTSFGLKSDGSIVAWGNGNKVPLPSPNRDFVAIAAGRFHCLGLKSDGSVVAWGPSNFSGQLTVPTPNYGFTAVAAGDSFSVGLKSDGTILSWGEVSCKFYPPNNNFVAITAGMKHCLGLKADGSIEGAGSGSWGQCRVPTPNFDYVAVAAGGNHSLALVPQGALQVTLAPPEVVAAGARWRLKDEAKDVWHDDTVYDPVTQTSSTVLKSRVGAHTLTFDDIKGWTRPADQSVELTTTATAQAVGLYKRIYFGLSTVCSSGTIQVSPAGTSFPMGSTVTLTAQPDAGCWFVHWTGDVPEGQEQINPLVLTMDTTKTVGVSLAAGPPPAAPVVTAFSINHGLVTTANPTVTLPNICTAETSGSAVQYLASESSDFTSATWQPYVSIPLFRLSSGNGTKTVYFRVKNSAGVESAVTSDTIVCRGFGNSIKAWGSSTTVPSPNEDFVALAVGLQHSLALKSNGSIVAWGANSFKQCDVPAPNRDFVAVAAGNYHSLGLKSDGSVVVWGSNSFQQYNVPTPNRDFAAVAAAGNYCQGLKSDGSVSVWGSDSGAGLSRIPVPNTGFVDIVAGEYHCLGLKSDGSIVGWGVNKFGELTVPSPNTDFISMSLGEEHGLGLKSDGSIVAWGQNNLGQCSVPEPNADFVSVAVGGFHSLGLKSDGSIAAWGKNDVGQSDVPTPNRAFTAIAGGLSLSLALVPDKGALQVTLTPAEAVASGAKWRIAGENTWHESGSPLTWPVGTCLLELLDLPGWYVEPTTRTVTIEPNELTSATVTYVSGQTWPLSMTAQNGTVAKSPSKTNYRAGEIVKLTATPAAGYHFTGWTGTTTSVANPLRLTMDSTQTLTANFAIDQYSLTANVLPTGSGTVTFTPTGDVYEFGTTVTVTATPAVGCRFVNWTGDASGSATSVQVLMNGNKTVTANFELFVPCTLTLVADPPEGGGVSKTPDLAYYDPGTPITVSAVPAEGYEFRGWWDGTTTVSTEATFEYPLPTMSATLVARFKPHPIAPITITLLADPPEGGMVSKSPDLAAYPQSTTVTLTAAPNAGYSFVGWYAGASLATTSTSYVLTVGPETFQTAFTAKFRPDNQYSLTLVANLPDAASLTKTPDRQYYEAGTTITVTAIPVAGYRVSTWMDGSVTITTYTRSFEYVMPEKDTTLTALLEVFCGCPGSVKAVADPAEGGTVTRTPDLDQDLYPDLSTVQLDAVAAEGFVFCGWYDGATTVTTQTSFQYTVRSHVEKVFTARFKPEKVPSYPVTIVADPVAGGTVSKSPDLPSYTTGTSVTLSAVAADGYKFYGWYDGDVRVSTETQYVYWVGTENKTFTAKFFVWHPCVVTLAADPAQGGTLSNTPDKGGYEFGDKVTLTAIPAEGYLFTGWYDGVTLLSVSTPYEYTVTAAHKTLTGKFSIQGPDTPTSLTAVGNTYRVLVSWAPVTSVTAFVVTRTAGDDVTSWTVTATEFADDTALPGVTYAYTVSTVDAQGAAGTPSEAVSASVTPETFTAAAYKVTAKGYAMTRDLPMTGGLTFTLTGPKAGTIKIAALKKLPKNTADNPAKGIYYLTNQGQVSTLAINGDVKTLSFDVPVYSLEATGLVKSVTAKSVTFLSAREFGKVSVAATKASEDGRYARTFIETAAATSATPLTIRTTGAVVEELVTTQPVKSLSAASKVYKDAAKAKKTSLGAVGSLPKVVAEISNTPPPQSEATPCSIQGHTLNFVTVSDGPIVADEIVGAIDKVTVSGGNLRAGLIQSSKNIVLLQATSKKVNGVNVGGVVGTAGKATALVVKAQPPVTGKSKTALTKVYGQTGVAGYFYAGYDASFQKGGIGVLQTKTGTVEGAAFLDPALVAKMKVLPNGQTIAVNPSM